MRNQDGCSHPDDGRLLLALDQELEPREAADIAAHVEQCGQCRARWEQWKAISGGIVEYHRALEAGVIPIAVKRPAGVRNVRHSGAWAAIAALVLIGLFLAESRWAAKKPGRPAPRLIAATHPAATAPLPIIVTAVATPRHNPRPRRGIETETFIGLPFSDGALPLADATIVRVDLSAEELRLAGVRVDGERADATIQADLLIGLDGLPRGIRFVQQ
jgi:anti-sigma factor ChrR (cupin superfamily)